MVLILSFWVRCILMMRRMLLRSRSLCVRVRSLKSVLVRSPCSRLMISVLRLRSRWVRMIRSVCSMSRRRFRVRRLSPSAVLILLSRRVLCVLSRRL